MNIQTIKDTVARHSPLVIKLSSGEQITVPHEDFIFFAPPVAGNVFIAVEANGRFHILDADQVVGVTLQHQPS